MNKNSLNNLTLEKCLEICEHNEAFKYKKEIIEGQEVYQFNYFLAQFNDFAQPLEYDTETEAFELRGLTFVKDGNETHRYLMLHKFFNINQTGGERKQVFDLTIDNKNIRAFENRTIKTKEEDSNDNRQLADNTAIIAIAKAFNTDEEKRQEFLDGTVREQHTEKGTYSVLLETKEGFFRIFYNPKTKTIISIPKDAEYVEVSKLEIKKYPAINVTHKENLNVKRTVSYMKSEIGHKQVKNIQDKLDGSLIRFVPFANGTVKAKTKFSFQSEQSEMAQKLYAENENIRKFLKEADEQNLAAMFEIVSPFNKIVIDYQKTELKLLQLRDEKTGEYYDIYNHPLVEKYNIAHSIPEEPKTSEEYKIEVSDRLNELEGKIKKITDKEELTEDDKELLKELNKKKDLVESFLRKNDDITVLDYYEVQQHFIENKEGWIFTFEDQMVKFKTTWYFQLHRLLTTNVMREDFIINAVLEDNIDDVLSQIPEEEVEKREMIENITKKVSNFINHNANVIFEIIQEDFKGNKKDFALKHRGHQWFGAMMSIVSKVDNPSIEHAEKAVINMVDKNYAKLNKAKEWLSQIPLDQESMGEEKEEQKMPSKKKNSQKKAM